MEYATEHYKGREEELKTIHDYWLESRSKDKLIFVGVTGLGGIGKSELAKKYAHKFYTEVQGHCIWMNVENDLAFTKSLHKLAKECGISLHESPGKEKALNSIMVEAFKRLSMNSCLVVFDNLENYQEDFLQYFVNFAKKIPPRQSKPFVILTSRYQLLNQEFGFLAKQIQLPVLSTADAVSFFQDSLCILDKNVDVLSDLQSLCHELDHFPLAMQQAAAYINELKQNSDTATEIKEYLKVYKSESKKLLKYPLPKYENSDSFSKPTYLTWQMTLDKLSCTPIIGSVVTLALSFISFFQSENISVTLLESLIELAISESKDAASIHYEKGSVLFATLRNYSMCQISKFDNKVYVSVHRLVQAVSQIKLKEEQKWAQTLNMLIQILNDIFEDAVTSDELPHIVSLLRYTEEDASAIVNRQKFFNLMEKLQYKYISTTLYQQGKIFSQFAVGQIKEIYGEEASQTLRITSNYGNILLRCGEQKAAKHLLVGVYKHQLKQFDEDYSRTERDLHILDTKCLIAETLINSGNYDEALKMYLEVLDIEERVLGIDHPDTLLTKHNIAGTRKSKGNYDEALKMYLEVLDIQERVLGIDHPDTLITKHNIAGTHKSKGNYDEALKMYLEGLNIQERVLGIDHPDTLTTKHNIAMTKVSKGNYDEGLKIYLEVLDIQERVLGIDHPETLLTKHNIARTHTIKGNYNEALKMYLEVLEGQKLVLGMDHPNTLDTKHCIKANMSLKLECKKNILCRICNVI